MFKSVIEERKVGEDDDELHSVVVDQSDDDFEVKEYRESKKRGLGKVGQSAK